jgi:putative ABC transport system permease protein
MSLFLGALTIGLILSLLALGVYMSFRVFKFPDITAEGSVTFGAAVSAVLLVQGMDPGISLLAAFAAGAVAGAVTGILHTKCKINELLAGILVMTALYSVNLHVMGKSNIPLVDAKSTSTVAEKIGAWIFGQTTDLNWFGWEVSIRDAGMLISMFAVVAAAAFILLMFFQTNLGTAIRATGDNPQMIRALGVDVDIMMILGLAISNGLIALAGALLAQYQGFADVQMGIGMMVWGLASVIIGEALVGSNKQGLVVAGTVIGSVLFRLLVAIALRWGLNPNDLKLITALFVFAALVGPTIGRSFMNKRGNQPSGRTV